MTLILTVQGKESIWLLADRRLSAGGRKVRDDAHKVMTLETTDGNAILGYTGLGATTPLGTQPADWMGAVLRGRRIPLEAALNVLADAIKRQIPRHLIQGGHSVMIPAILGKEVRFYTTDLLARNRKSYKFRHARHVDHLDTMRTPRLGIGGSGTAYLLRDKSWMRPLLHLVNACDRKRISPRAVADHLAAINVKVASGTKDHSVGPRSIVVWRNKKQGIHQEGGGHQFYTETDRDRNSAALPTITSGMDITAICGVLMPRFLKEVGASKAGNPIQDFNKDEINEELARLPHKPDENLR